MTPLAGFIIALIAGWIARDARRAAVVVVVPYLAVVAGQTWAIYDGRGSSPPSTVWPLRADHQLLRRPGDHLGAGSRRRGDARRRAGTSRRSR